ncbi:hypothetical protein Q0M94_28560 (plasmid) [Deinococcus radiomollis]|uniref:hypothetical protein n=1 Tax=Deinococcus radiomollis TaxID=468916 RepID=UPI003891C393
MTKPSRFGMVSSFRESAGETPSPPDAQTPKLLSGRGGKSSSGEFDKTTLYLNKAAKLEAQRRLLGSGEDLSTLVSRLLSEWLEG